MPLQVDLTVVDAASGDPIDGAAEYLWHCDREGRYSLYSPGATEENYLRGVQDAAADGTLRFTTVFPGAYSGRYPHIHFEVYPSLDAATRAGTRITTSQLTLPQQACELAYATDGYEQSVTNFARTPIDQDMVFSDGYAAQMASVTGDASAMTATLTIPV